MWCYSACLETYANVSRVYRLNRKVFSVLGQHCITFSKNKVGLSGHTKFYAYGEGSYISELSEIILRLRIFSKCWVFFIVCKISLQFHLNVGDFRYLRVNTDPMIIF